MSCASLDDSSPTATSFSFFNFCSDDASCFSSSIVFLSELDIFANDSSSLPISPVPLGWIFVLNIPSAMSFAAFSRFVIGFVILLDITNTAIRLGIVTNIAIIAMVDNMLPKSVLNSDRIASSDS